MFCFKSKSFVKMLACSIPHRILCLINYKVLDNRYILFTFSTNSHQEERNKMFNIPQSQVEPNIL